MLRPGRLVCEPLEDGLELRFALGPGEYATSLLADRFALTEGAPGSGAPHTDGATSPQLEGAAR